jgi:hypothetical protein
MLLIAQRWHELGPPPLGARNSRGWQCRSSRGGPDGDRSRACGTRPAARTRAARRGLARARSPRARARGLGTPAWCPPGAPEPDRRATPPPHSQPRRCPRPRAPRSDCMRRGVAASSNGAGIRVVLLAAAMSLQTASLAAACARSTSAPRAAAPPWRVPARRPSRDQSLVRGRPRVPRARDRLGSAFSGLSTDSG